MVVLEELVEVQEEEVVAVEEEEVALVVALGMEEGLEQEVE